MNVKYIAFLRAINVGGHTVTMARLRELFVELGLRDVRTFIASGNVLFDSRAVNVTTLESRIESHLAAALRFESAVFIRTPGEVEATSLLDPFGPAKPGTVRVSSYIGFLRSLPTDDAIARLMQYVTSSDQLHVYGRELYWRRTGATTESRLAAGAMEKALGMPVTVRNVNTVRKIAFL